MEELRAHRETHGISSASDLKTIAKAVRSDLKKCKSVGLLDKGTKVSVRTDYYSGGQALRVEIKDCAYSALNPVRCQVVAKHPDWINFPEEVLGKRYSEKAEQEMATINAVVAFYNWDKSDSQSDYFHVNFYGGTASYSRSITERDRRAAGVLDGLSDHQLSVWYATWLQELLSTEKFFGGFARPAWDYGLHTVAQVTPMEIGIKLGFVSHDEHKTVRECRFRQFAEFRSAKAVEAAEQLAAINREGVRGE